MKTLRNGFSAVLMALAETNGALHVPKDIFRNSYCPSGMMEAVMESGT